MVSKTKKQITNTRTIGNSLNSSTNKTNRLFMDHIGMPKQISYTKKLIDQFKHNLQPLIAEKNQEKHIIFSEKNFY